MAGLSGNKGKILEGKEAAVLSAPLLSVLDEARGEKAPVSNKGSPKNRVPRRLPCRPFARPGDQLRRSSTSQR